MKITKQQLRRIIREACGLAADPEGMHALPAELPQMMPAQEPMTDPNIPSPQDYEATRDFMDQNPDLVDLGLSLVMDMAGTSCERSTAQGVIDHLQDMLDGGAQEDLSLPPMIEV